jgi:glycine betaine/proline transport system substrate-binding protein
MLKISKLVSFAVTAVVVSGQALFAGNVPESNDPIKVTIQDWTGQHFSTHVAAGLLKEMGYNVEIVVSDAITQHPAIASGNINLSTEVWTNNVGGLYDGLVEKGDIVVVGELGTFSKRGLDLPTIYGRKMPRTSKL